MVRDESLSRNIDESCYGVCIVHILLPKDKLYYFRYWRISFEFSINKVTRRVSGKSIILENSNSSNSFSVGWTSGNFFSNHTVCG